MENKKGSGIFLGVIGVATLIVAIIGATFAYFSANISSDEGAVTAGGAILDLGYKDVKDGLKMDLIPAEDYIALFAATDETHIGDKGQCKDDNGNSVCGIYTFTIGNPSFTTSQDLYGKINVTANEMPDLWFAIYDELGEQVVAPKNFTTEADKEGNIDLSELNQKLLASSLDSEDNGTYVKEDPTTYTPINDMTNPENKGKLNNVRTYTLVMWIEEEGRDQTEANSGKTFAAGITFTTASDTNGVTGIIAAAPKPGE